MNDVLKLAVKKHSATRTSLFKDCHREKAPSNKTPALTESTSMDIWVVSASNQHVAIGS